MILCLKKVLKTIIQEIFITEFTQNSKQLLIKLKKELINRVHGNFYYLLDFLT